MSNQINTNLDGKFGQGHFAVQAYSREKIGSAPVADRLRDVFRV